MEHTGAHRRTNNNTAAHLTHTRRYPPVDGTKAFLLTWFARNLPLLPSRVSGVLKLLVVAAPLLYAAYMYWRPRIGL